VRSLPREATPGSAEQLEGVVGEQYVVGVGAHPAAWARRLIGAIVGACKRPIGVRKDEELEVIVAERQLLEARKRFVQRHGSVDTTQGEGGDTTESDLGDHAQRAEADARGAEDLGVDHLGTAQGRAVGEHEYELDHLRGDVAQASAGPVRRRGDRAGDALDVDVPEVLQRQPVLGQARIQLTDCDSPLHAHQPGGAVDVEHTGEPVQA
jgi:hypothetical protein